ncbi:MAG: hypothetical protein R6V03_03050 [Kiritimatiellia bacterium]
MNDKDDVKKVQTNRKDAFSRIALWQFLVFILLITFVWANEKIDLPAWLFGVEPSGFNLYRGLTLTAAVIIAAVVAVGNTYLQQRRIVDKLMTTCLYCHRVKTGEDQWEHIEEYFMKNFPISLSTKACPECRKMLSSMETGPESPSGQSSQ